MFIYKFIAYHFIGEHADVDLVMDAAVRLEDEVSGCLHELVRAVAQEEVALEYLKKKQIKGTNARQSS